MKRRLSFVLITIFLACLGRGGALLAQSPRTIELGPYGGISTTLNDINTLKFFSEPGYETGGLIRYNHDTRWSFRLDYTHSMVRSSDAIAKWRPERDKSFIAFINNVGMMVEFNFLDFYTGRSGSSISPYIFGGISRFKYQTFPYLTKEQQISYVGDSVSQNLESFNKAWQSSEPSTITGTSYSIPFGFGCKISISEHLATSIEWRMNYTFSDEIDGLEALYSDEHQYAYVHYRYKKNSKNEIEKDKAGNPLKEYLINDNPISPEGYTPNGSYDLTDTTGLFKKNQQMSNSKSNDWFGSFTVSLTWKIPLPGGGACRVNSY